MVDLFLCQSIRHYRFILDMKSPAPVNLLALFEPFVRVTGNVAFHVHLNIKFCWFYLSLLFHLLGKTSGLDATPYFWRFIWKLYCLDVPRISWHKLKANHFTPLRRILTFWGWIRKAIFDQTQVWVDNHNDWLFCRSTALYKSVCKLLQVNHETLLL